MAGIVEIVRALVAPLSSRIRLLCSRGTISLVDDDRRAQEVQLRLLASEVKDEVESFAHYGFGSNPPLGTEAIVLCLGGNRDHPIVVATVDRKTRPRGLLAGEVHLYNGLTGTRILLKDDGSIVITGATKLTLDGDLEVMGEITAGGDITSAAEVSDSKGTLNAHRESYNSHTHVENGDGGGITDQPIPQV